MSYIQNLFTSRDNNAVGNTYVGQEGRIWWNPDANAFYYSDGATPGGFIITGGGSGNGVPGGPVYSVQVNAGGGNFDGNLGFTYNAANGNVTITADTYTANIYAVANNISNIGSATNRFYDLWLGSGNINLIDDTLTINQEINASNGNLVITGGNGIKFGEFAMYGNIIATQNPTANINIGLPGDTAYVDIDRPLAVNSSGGGAPSFIVEQNGTVEIFNTNSAANTAGALNIVGTSSGAYQNVTNSGGMIHVTGPDNSAARVTVDAFGSSGGTGVPAAFVGRVGRGTAASPTAVQANDVMVRLGAVGWATTGFTAPSPTATAIEFVALQNFTDAAQGTKITFNTAATGANSRSVSATVQANGLSFLNNTTANSGITFHDGTFQNTAFVASEVVSSLTAGAGISLSSSTGNITIGSTGVLGVEGTTNQISVANVGNVLTLSLPQDFNTAANVQLYSLTVNDLIILGNVSNVIPSVVGGNIIYVANTATNFSGINNSGLVTGNIANSVWAGILYNTTSNTWVMDIGNSNGITSDTIYATNVIANANVHLGNASNNYDFPNALLQGDVNVNTYGQFVLKNHNQGASASADIVAVANNGDDGSYYIDMGINSNVYANVDYAVTGANDGYLYVNGGNLVIGTQTTAKVIKFFTDGTDNVSNVRLTINSTGITTPGNVTGSNVIANTAAIGGTISATGNVIGGNVNSTGIMSSAGNILGQNVNTAIVSATGNIVGANIRTGGSVSATANVVGGNLTTGAQVVATGNITGGNIITAGAVSAVGAVSATGNVTGGNVNTGGNISATGFVTATGNVTGGNILTAGIMSSTGNATHGNISAVANINTVNLAVTGISNLNSNANVHITGGIPGQSLATDGAGNLFWTSGTGGNTVIINGAVTSNVNIDFTYNSTTLVYIPTANVNITLSNYTAGHTARVIVRYGATPFPIVLGVGNTAQSTEGLTTIPISGAGGHNLDGNSCCQLLYTCFDNTAANCYVASTFL